MVSLDEVYLPAALPQFMADTAAGKSSTDDNGFL